MQAGDYMFEGLLVALYGSDVYWRDYMFDCLFGGTLFFIITMRFWFHTRVSDGCGYAPLGDRRLIFEMRYCRQ